MQEVVQGWMGKKVLCAGDCCRDVWIYGTVHRTSPEAPVPVVLEDSRQETPGMSGLVASMIDALGGKATLVTTDNRPIKTRIMARVPGRGYQPLCRLDTEACDPISETEADNLLSEARQALLDGCTAILVCDYAKGACTPYLCRELRRLAGQFRVPIAVDPGRGADWSMYRGMIVKANGSEMANSDWAPVNAIKQLGLPALIITLGQGGMDVIVDDPTGPSCIGKGLVGQPVDGLDVTGAGDQVMAVLGLGLAAFGRELDREYCGGPLLELCEVANVAARLQVQRHGCVPVTAPELEAELAKQLMATVAA